MALSIGSQILVSDISNALAGKQDALGYVPVKSVNGTTADASGNVAISTGITTVKAQIGSAWAANSTSMTLPSGGTWFVFNTGSTGYGNSYGSQSGVSNSKNATSTGYQLFGGTYAGGTTVYAKQTRYFDDGEGSTTYSVAGKLAAIRIS